MLGLRLPYQTKHKFTNKNQTRKYLRSVRAVLITAGRGQQAESRKCVPCEHHIMFTELAKGMKKEIGSDFRIPMGTALQ